MHPGVSGHEKPKNRRGRRNWRWLDIAAELHRLWEESCLPSQPITLPPNADQAAIYLGKWMKREWDAGRRPEGMKTEFAVITDRNDYYDPNEPSYNPKKIGDRIRKRYSATSLRDLGYFMGGGAGAYQLYFRKMVQVREEAAAKRAA